MPRVSITDSSKSFEVQEGDIIYDSLHSQGENLPHGCLSGSCGACKVEILKGASHLSPLSPVEENTIEAIKEEFTQLKGAKYVEGKTIRLSCRARVYGDIEFKPFK